ncbi:TetR/AcrR family transcriptional regulator [Bacillus sp. WMMC1349]|uniref:TetR/AcrR family transcriptional regulator n=1 Tax=Bacillus sp. WMMC1349 TaxID=2736254 RepID=UPI00155482CD|nr:TetR/AcrR family transcriptional regulator [Bacillus sp. WMMC1349]NPC91573.1 TetR/AcrR family transcriptional regulator [Bacillus sp. WMMC1349]
MTNGMQAKERILKAAQDLFYKKGYEQVTVREIARKANCSHTSIYVYFYDKRKLLEELAKEPLELLIKEMNSTLKNSSYSSKKQLLRISKIFVHFGLSYRNLYQAFMNFEATRVDIPTTKWELNETRLVLFDILKTAVSKNFLNWSDEKVTEFSRTIYYMLHGMILTYIDVDERMIQIEKRVFPIIEQSINYLMMGAMVDENSQGIS